MRLLCFALLLSSTALADAPIETVPDKAPTRNEIKLERVDVDGTVQKPLVVVIPRAQRANHDVNAASDQHLNDALRH